MSENFDSQIERDFCGAIPMNDQPCTCHPSEAPVPCPKKYALTDCLLSAAKLRIRELEQERDRLLKFCPFEEENVALQAQLAAVTQERDRLREDSTKWECIAGWRESDLNLADMAVTKLQAHNKAMREALEKVRGLFGSGHPLRSTAARIADAALTLTQEKPA